MGPTTTTTNAIQAIEGIAQDADASAITVAVLTTAGATDYNAELLAAYQVAISKAADGTLDTLAKIQTMINLVNTTSANAIQLIDAIYNYDASAITEAELTATGVTGYNEDVLSVYQYEIEEAANFELDTLAKIQEMIEMVNTRTTNAIQTIEDIFQNGGATAVTMAVLEDAGVTGLNEDILNDYQDAISTAPDGALDTLAKIQATIDAI